MITDFYRSRSIKRHRRTKAEIEQLKDALLEIVEEIRPATVRQIFYQAVSRGVIDKTEKAYHDVVRWLTALRLGRLLPFDAIADNTRWQRKPVTYPDMETALKRTAECYRRSVWDDQDVRCEVWLEKDALAGVIVDVTAEWDVPLMVTRGYPSISYLAAAAEIISYQDKPTWIYYLGDWDPSGVDISRNIQARLRELAFDAEINFRRVAVNPDQIEYLHLPTRPTKSTDSRARKFTGESVELDAMEPKILRAMVRWCIEHHIDRERLAIVKAAEQSERSWLEMIARTRGGAGERT